jgi:hypothetical protein
MNLIRKNGSSDSRGCRCGALMEHGMRRCRKCRARSRWRRRRTGKPRSTAARRPETRQPRRGR